MEFAKHRKHRPALVVTLGLAPRIKSSSVTPRCPERTASCRGVRPFLFVCSKSALG